MGSAIVDGFKDGFQMMEQHEDREFKRKRLSDIDAQNALQVAKRDKQREEDIQYRNEQFKYNKERNAKSDELDSKQKNSLLNLSETRNKAANWQLEQQKEQKAWGIIAPQLPNIHEQFMETGELSEQAKSFFSEHPEYNDYNPETYLNEDYRKTVDELHALTQEAFTKKTPQLINSTKYLELFNGAFNSKVRQGIGEFNHVLNAKVTNKRVAKLIPTESGKVTIGLEVTYQKPNGESFTELQPMTKGRTSDSDDVVQQFDMRELFAGLETRKRMAELVNNKDHYSQRSNKALGRIGKNKSVKPEWKEVKDDMGATTGYQELNSGEFQPVGENTNGNKNSNSDDPLSDLGNDPLNLL
jgi:hypothetical protein